MEKLDKIIKRERDLLQKKLQEAQIPAERAEVFIQDFIRFITGSPEIPSLPAEDIVYFDSMLNKDLSQKAPYISYLSHKAEIIVDVMERGWSMDVIHNYESKPMNRYNEPMIDWIEQQHQVRLRDEDHLTKLLDLPELTEKGLKVARNLNLKVLIEEAKFSKYGRALELTIERGGDFNDLMDIDPSIYALQENWMGVFSYDRYSTVLLTIARYFNLMHPRMTVSPNFRLVAKEMNVPYSVMMDLHKLTNKHQRVTQRANIENL